MVTEPVSLPSSNISVTSIKLIVYHHHPLLHHTDHRETPQSQLPSMARTDHACDLGGSAHGFEKKPPKILKKTVDGIAVHEPNPAYAQWVAQDQFVLGYMLSSLTREVLTGVGTMTTSIEVWEPLARMFASRTRARSMWMCMELATFRKGSLSIAE
jgi:hypothetical protein